MTADENLLSRWSRLKDETRDAEEKPPRRGPEVEPAPIAATGTPALGKESPAAAPVAADLPPIESLKGLASEYAEFLKPGVDESLRRSALKKLFSDPYFATFEKFEAYCEDYTQGEPIPAAMLKTLEHAKGLLFDEEKEEKEQAIARTETQAPVQVVAKVEEPEKAQEEVREQPREKA
jgi:hypothetical protein